MMDTGRGILDELEQQEQERQRKAVLQLNPRLADPATLQSFLDTAPEGREVAAQKLIGSAAYATQLGLEPQYVYDNWDMVTASTSRDGKPLAPGKVQNVLAENWKAREVGTKMDRLYDDIRKLRDEQAFYGSLESAGRMVANAATGAAFQAMNLNQGPTGPLPIHTGDSRPVATNEKYQKLIEAKQAELEALQAIYQPPTDTEGAEWWADAALSVGQSMADSILTPETAVAVGAGLATGGASGAHTLGAIGKNALAGAAKSMGWGVSAAMARQQAGSTYRTLLESGVTHEVASPVAGAVGVLTGLMERAQFNTLTGIADGAIIAAVKKAVEQGTKKTLTTRGLAAVAKTFVTRLGANTLEETGVEVLQEATSILGEAIAQEIDKDLVSLEDRITAYKALDRLLETAKTAGAGMLLISAPGAAVGTIRDARTASQAGKAAIEAMREMPLASPEVKQAAIEELMSGDGRLAAFREKQATTPTAFSREGEPETFYHGSAESGAPVMYRNAYDAALAMDDHVQASPEAIMDAVRQKYGQAAGEWMGSVLQGQEVLTDAAKAEIGDQINALKEAAENARQGAFDFRSMTEQARDTLEGLGVDFAGKKLVATHLDIDPARVWSGTEEQFAQLQGKEQYDAFDLGDKVILNPGTDKIIAAGAVDAGQVRIPTRNGKIVTKREGGRIQAINPATGEAMADMTLEDGPLARVTSLPENPVHARQMLRALKDQGTDYALEIPQAQIDEILETDPGYRKAQRALAEVALEKAGIAAQHRQAIESGEIDPGKLEYLEAITLTLENAEAQALAAMEEYRQQLLGEYDPLYAREPEAVAEQVRESAEQNREAWSDLTQQISLAAPQLATVAPALVRLIEVAANAQGKTLAEWRNLYLARQAFIQGDASGNRASVQWLQEGQALITLTTKSDPTSVIHELGHIMRRQLAPEDQAKLLEHYQAQEWTVEAEEAFASDWERYFHEGKAPTAELASIFQRIARFFRMVYGYLRGQIDPEVRAIIDRALTDADPGKPLVEQGAELYQPDGQKVQYRVIDVFQNGTLVQHIDDYRGISFDAQSYPNGTTRWTISQKIPSSDMYSAISSMGEFSSLEEAESHVAMVRSRNTRRKNTGEKYGKIPRLWTGIRKKVAKIFIDAGVDIDRFIGSDRSESIYIYLGNGKKIRISNHDLPGDYDRPDFDLRYNDNLSEFANKIAQSKQETEYTLFQPAPPTDSEAFRAWFGDSKVVDAEGKPLVVYRGHTESPSEYSDSMVFFTDNLETAKAFAAYHGKQNRKVGISSSFYLMMQNPLIIDANGSTSFDIPKPEDMEKAYGGRTGSIEEFWSWADQNGHDGVIVKNVIENEGPDVPTTVYVTTSPTQIKSVNNTGTWSPDDPRILYQPEYTLPAETRAILEQIDSLEAEGRTASPERQKAIGEQLAPLYKAVGSSLDLWLHSLEEAFSAGSQLPTTSIADAARYGAEWALEELEFRKAMDYEPDQDVPPNQILTRKEYEKAFLERLEANPDEILQRIRDTVRSFDDIGNTGWVPDEITQAQLTGMRQLLTGPLYSYVNAKDPNKARKGSDKTVREIAIQSLRNNPSTGMELAAYADGDLEKVAVYDELEKREPLAETAEAKERAERDRTKKLDFQTRVDRLRTILGKSFSKASAEEIEATYQETSLELRRLTSAYKSELAAHKALDQRYTSLSRVYEKDRARLREIAQELEAIKRTKATLEKNATQERDALRARRDQLKAEIQKLKATVKEYQKEAAYRLKWNSAEWKQKMELALAQLKAKQERRDELRKAREYKQALIKQIKRPVSKGVDWEYAKQIHAIQDQLDPRKRTRATKLMADWYAEHPAFIKAIQQALGREPDVQTVPEGPTIAQLEEMLEQIIVLEIEGRAKRDLYVAAEAQKVAMAQHVLSTALADNFPQINGTMKQADGKPGALRQLWNSLEEMQHLMDQFDGAALTYNGPFWRNVYRPMAEASRSATENISRRAAVVQALMKQHGIKEGEVYNALEVDGKPFIVGLQKTKGRGKNRRIIDTKQSLTINTAMGIFMASQNEQSRAALTYGNKITEAEQAAIIKALPQKFKDFADGLIDQVFDPDYDRLAEVHNRVNNKEMGRVDRYYPMMRQQTGGAQFEEELSWEAMARAGTKRSPKDGMTKGRVRVGEEMQTPIRLDAIGVTFQSIDKQERYIAFAELAKHMGRVFNSRSQTGKPITDIMDAVRPGTTRQILDWVSAVVNRDAARDDATRALLRLKKGMSTYAMGFNIKTALNNLSGLPLYMAESGPLELLKSTVLTPVQFKKARERMASLAPEMDRRSIDQSETLARSYANSLQYVEAKFQQAAFWFMKSVVNAVDTIGWTAVFEAKKKQGMSDQDAATQASAAVLRTQPSGDPLAQSPMESSPILGIVTPFASQTFKIWNQLAHLPDAKKQGAVARYAMKVAGVVLGSVMFYGLVGAVTSGVKAVFGEDDDKDERKQTNIILELLRAAMSTAVPVVGSPAAAILDGYGTNSPVETQLSAFNAVRKILSDANLTEKEKTWVLDQLGKSASSFAGLPYISMSRIMKAITDADATALQRVIHALVGGEL